MAITLNSKVIDKITKYTGVVVAICRYASGTSSAIVQAEGLNKDGKPYENSVSELDQLELVESGMTEREWDGPMLLASVKDKITGCSGVVVALAQWMHGCNRVLVQPKELKDGVPVKDAWFDVNRVELIEQPKESVRPAGGPEAMPERY
jgi:hypothetical protein